MRGKSGATRERGEMAPSGRKGGCVYVYEMNSVQRCWWSKGPWHLAT